MSTNFHFQIVGDDQAGNRSLLKLYASGRDVVMDGAQVNIKLSMYTDPTEGTVTLGEMLSSDDVDGYLFIYDVSDKESFKRLKSWMFQVDSKSTSIIEEPKILIGNLTNQGERVVEYEAALALSESANMIYHEVDLNEDVLGIDKAINALMNTKQPTTPKHSSRKLFFRQRSQAHSSKHDLIKPMPLPTRRKRSKTLAVSEPFTMVDSPTELFSGKDFQILSKSMLELNMSVAKTAALIKISTKNKTDVIKDEIMSESSTLNRFLRVIDEANKYLEASQEKIKSLTAASNEIIEALKERVEEAYEEIDNITGQNVVLKAEISNLQQHSIKVEKEMNRLKQELQAKEDSSHWKVCMEEVEMTSQTLGTGGYGAVTVAKFRGLQVAAKRLHGMIINSYNRRIFEREMNIASQVRHPNCVQFLGAVVGDKEPIILMELMPTVLRDIIPKEEKKLTQEQIPPIYLDIARALTYLHAMKPDPIIHRDISSANVLLEPTAHSLWKAKVSDYGSANFLSMLSTKGPGNAVYAAPEACSPQLQSTKMDVFSFGVLVIEMHLREFPDQDNRDQMLHEVELLYPGAAPVIKKCLNEDPSERLHMSDILDLLSK